MKSFIVDKKISLSKFLMESYNGSLSYSHMQKLIRNKDIKVNDKRVSKDIQLTVGDKIEVYFDGEATKLLPTIVYQDDNVLLVVKPKNINSEYFFEALKQNFNNLFFCHRLDRNTDGIMLFAKNETAYNEIYKGFKNKQFDKYYIAEVYSAPERDSGVLTAYLLKNENVGKVEIFFKQVKGSKKIETEYRVLEKKNNSSILLVKPITGRTHQIRAHLAKIGCFVLGDGKYGNDEINRSQNITKLMLTAVKIVLHFNKDSFLAYLNDKEFTIKEP